MVLMCPYN